MASVVVLEDDRALLSRISRELDVAGHDVAGFSEWAPMLNLLDTGFPCDVFVTELSRPPGTPNGHALAQMARARRPRLEIIYIDRSPASPGLDDLLAGIVVQSRSAPDIAAAVSEALASDGPLPKPVSRSKLSNPGQHP